MSYVSANNYKHLENVTARGRMAVRAANVMRRDEKTPVTLGEGIEIDFQNPVM